MQFKFETWLDYFIFFIIFIKVIFVFSAIGHVVVSRSSSSKTEKLESKLLYWKERTEFIFIVAMSILLIYHFTLGYQVNLSIKKLLYCFSCLDGFLFLQLNGNFLLRKHLGINV